MQHKASETHFTLHCGFHRIDGIHDRFPHN